MILANFEALVFALLGYITQRITVRTRMAPPTSAYGENQMRRSNAAHRKVLAEDLARRGGFWGRLWLRATPPVAIHFVQPHQKRRSTGRNCILQNARPAGKPEGAGGTTAASPATASCRHYRRGMPGAI